MDLEHDAHALLAAPTALHDTTATTATIGEIQQAERTCAALADEKRKSARGPFFWRRAVAAQK